MTTSDPTRSRRPRAPGMPFLLFGIAFAGVGVSPHHGALLAIAPVFLAIGIVFLVRARAARTSNH